ncbi:MAG: hypothetical protein M3299_00310 [Thermoproteota archaeon]|nr:hypothetical protein [Thermoproteota archaeon]
MKFGVFVHPKRPKVSVEQIVKRIQFSGLLYSPKEPDVAIVVGGDGTFGYYGRILAVPMLFVGVKESEILGSRARLAETMYDCLDKTLFAINAGRYRIAEKRMLSVNFGGQDSHVLTDVYLERGEFAGCIRYLLQVKKEDSLFKEYGLVCVEAPTEGFTASNPIKKFLGKLKGIDLDGKYGFAFDTKLDSRFSGSAGKHIEKELSNRGLIIIAPRESAIVFSMKEKGAITGARLKEGEEERFRKIGKQLGKALAAKTRMVRR